jgi:hypothetical protein
MAAADFKVFEDEADGRRPPDTAALMSLSDPLRGGKYVLQVKRYTPIKSRTVC